MKVPELDAKQAFDSRIDVEYTTSTLAFELDKLIQLSDPPDEHCRRDRFWETKDPLIRRAAERIMHSSLDINDFLLNTFTWIREKVKLLDPQSKRLGAASAIRELTGDCDELSDLFIAICRAANIPCRRVVGLFYHGREARSFDWHAWAEVRTGKDTWIPFDPSLGFFASISERHLARCCMGRRSDYPLRKLTWRSSPAKPAVLNDDDIEDVVLLSN